MSLLANFRYPTHRKTSGSTDVDVGAKLHVPFGKPQISCEGLTSGDSVRYVSSQQVHDCERLSGVAFFTVQKVSLAFTACKSGMKK